MQAYFNTRVLEMVQRLHKHMMGWDEVLTPGLPKDVVVQSWRGVASLTKGAKLGYKGVLSAPYYLDAMKPASVHYLADPLPSSADLTPEQRNLILGGEVCMWGEHVYSRTVDSRIWPRTAAIAERYWSPENVRDVDDMYSGLEVISIELESLGLTHLQSGDAGLRELAGTEQIDALRVFASVTEPVSFGERRNAQHTNQLTELDRFVDALRPDPPSRHWSEMLTKQFLADPKRDEADRAILDAWFRKIGDAVPEIKKQIEKSPRLQDEANYAHQLSYMAENRARGARLSGYGNKSSGRLEE